MRDHYQKVLSHSASATLVKAMLIDSAVDLLDVKNDGSNDNDYPIPNVHEGWGLVQLDMATDGSHRYVDNGAGIGTGGSKTYEFNMLAGSPLKVSWSGATAHPLPRPR